MKNSVKLFALALVGLTLFSCTTDDYDTALEESVKVTENIQSIQSKEGDIDENQNSNIETDPLIIVKKD